MTISKTPGAGPAVVTAAALAMLAWSWGTWPDPLVDFGAQLYVPWQISAGRVLYRDIAYYNGPLSSYLNAAAFLIAGVSLRTLVWTNLFILSAMMVVAYRLTARVAGRGVAVMGGVTFALIFAFGQTVLIANYNWVTPYTHELTHGTALGLAAIAAAARYQRNGRSLWIIITGVLLGLVFLTKAEPTAASFAAVGVLLLAGCWVGRVQPAQKLNEPFSDGPEGRGFRHSEINSTALRAVAKRSGSQIILVVACVLLLPALAALLLATSMPLHQAIRGVLGSWPWAFDRRVTSLNFYKNVTGLNDVSGNLATMLDWSIAYVVLLTISLVPGLAIKTRRVGRIAALASFILVFGGLMIAFNRINWTGMITPLPICLVIAFAVAAWDVLRGRTPPEPAALRLSLIVFSIVLLAKMGLKPHVYHYGFVLAWPGTIVLIAMVGSVIPDWITRRGGSPAVLRAVGFAAWLVAVFAVLNRDAVNFADKRFTVAANTPDAFLASSCGQEVQAACDQVGRLLPPGGTLAVFPQGLMINYVTRRANPIPNVNFMPPEVLAAGEPAILAALNQHPPDVIVLTSSVVQDNRFTLDGRDDYGHDTLAWIKQHYQPVAVIDLPKPLPTIYRFVISTRKHR